MFPSDSLNLRDLDRFIKLAYTSDIKAIKIKECVGGFSLGSVDIVIYYILYNRKILIKILFKIYF